MWQQDQGVVNTAALRHVRALWESAAVFAHPGDANDEQDSLIVEISVRVWRTPE